MELSTSYAPENLRANARRLAREHARNNGYVNVRHVKWEIVVHAASTILRVTYSADMKRGRTTVTASATEVL